MTPIFFRASVAQHAGNGPAPVDPLPLHYLIYLEKRALLSPPLRSVPANLRELLNGKFYSRPLLEWQLSVAEGGQEGGLDKVNGLLNRRRAPNSLINAVSGPCPRRR